MFSKRDFIEMMVLCLSFNPYFTGLPILIEEMIKEISDLFKVSILILLDYLFLYNNLGPDLVLVTVFQSLFYWITYSYPFC